MTRDTVTFNINHEVGIRMTDVGRKLYEADWRGIGLDPPALRCDADGVTWMQMWMVMRYFGRGLRHGFIEPIEMNIRLRAEDITREDGP